MKFEDIFKIPHLNLQIEFYLKRIGINTISSFNKLQMVE